MSALRVKLVVVSMMKLSSSNSNNRQVYVHSTWHKLQNWLRQVVFMYIYRYDIAIWYFKKADLLCGYLSHIKKPFFIKFNSKETCIKIFVHLWVCNCWHNFMHALSDINFMKGINVLFLCFILVRFWLLISGYLRQSLGLLTFSLLCQWYG